jgi:hypothetical protein
MSDKQTGQGYQSFEQLMAQRYPQTNRSNSAHIQQAQQSQGQRQQFNSQQSLNFPQQGAMYQHGRTSLVPQGPVNNVAQSIQSSLGATNPPAGTTSNSKTMSSASGTSSAKKETSKAPAMSLTFNTPQQKQQLLHCDWKDKVLWATRLILGGNSINGFLRATATAQRIKKQRARQTALTKKQAAAAAATAAGTTPVETEEKPKDPRKGFDQLEEEKLKKEIMNPRTAKKIQSELEHGLLYCASVHNILRGILFDVDPSFAPHLPTAIMIEDDQPQLAPHASPLKQTFASTPAAQAKPKESNNPMAGKFASTSQPISAKQPLQSQLNNMIQPQAAAFVRSVQSSKTTASPGDSSGSTLRKMRKKKLPPNTEPPIELPEFDPSGRRVCSKKEHHSRLFKALRFRALKQGDFVAARLTSRDLWILAMVQTDYPGYDLYPGAFVKLSDQKRDALFKKNVVVKDVEDKDRVEAAMVPRNLALPLPRTYAEAAEWATR